MTYQRHEESLSSQDQPPREIELKLSVPESSADAIEAQLQARSTADQGTVRRHEVTTYFDTNDWALARGGVSLRVRSVEGGWIQTLKADLRGGVAADRAEWEWPIEQATPDLCVAGQILADQGLSPELDLQPVFRTEVNRAIRKLNLDGGAVIEAAFDQGLIATGDVRHPVRELELELRDGEAAPLFRLACQLHAAASVMIETESKATRGYRLARGVSLGSQKSKEISINDRMSGAEAFRQIINDTLGHLLTNQPAALAADAEGVHQIRIAIRRLRAALVLFRSLLEPHAAALFQDELRRVGRVFGEARDWDVLCLQIVPDALKAERNAGWRDLLMAPAEAARTAAHAGLAQEIRSPAFTRLVLGLAAWAEEIRLSDNARTRLPIEDLCPGLLERLAAKVARRGKQIRHRSETELHALRKSLKKLRYSIDFLQPVLPAEPLKSYLHDCKKLQSALGEINDTVAAMALAERLAKGVRLDLAPAVGVLGEVLRRRRNDALEQLSKRWSAFSGQPHFWG